MFRYKINKPQFGTIIDAQPLDVVTSGSWANRLPIDTHAPSDPQDLVLMRGIAPSVLDTRTAEWAIREGIGAETLRVYGDQLLALCALNNHAVLAELPAPERMRLKELHAGARTNEDSMHVVCEEFDLGIVSYLPAVRSMDPETSHTITVQASEGLAIKGRTVVEVGGPTNHYDINPGHAVPVTTQPNDYPVLHGVHTRRLSPPITTNVYPVSHDAHVLVDCLADGRALPLRTASTDVVMAANLPYDVTNGVVTEAARVLRVGGNLVLEHAELGDLMDAKRAGLTPRKVDIQLSASMSMPSCPATTTMRVSFIAEKRS